MELTEIEEGYIEKQIHFFLQRLEDTKYDRHKGPLYDGPIKRFLYRALEGIDDPKTIREIERHYQKTFVP